MPLQWAMTQSNLGNSLQNIGKRESVTARLEEAVAVFRAALEKIAAEDTSRAELEAGHSLRTVFARHGVL